jgi:Restriction endonuclease BsobI
MRLRLAEGMSVKPEYREHLVSSESLETTYESVRAGFVALALEKNRRATPHIQNARAFQFEASKAKNPRDLLHSEPLQSSLLTASGVSDKASKHLTESDKSDAIRGLIENFLEPAGKSFVEELVFRFLLISGDTLGGSMRNVGGFLAQKKLTRALISRLELFDQVCWWLDKNAKTETWNALTDDNVDIELNCTGLAWVGPNGPRTLRYNLTIPFLKNNVDLLLFNRDHESFDRSTLTDPKAYVALGELKGGIDPAGADEHWKTASKALDRIAKSFQNKKHMPLTFFIGAAIERKMAKEIWQMLQRGKLNNAANLTDERQIVSIANWICSL